MLTVKVGIPTMARAQKLTGRMLISLIVLMASFLFLLVILLRSNAADEDASAETSEVVAPQSTKKASKRSADPCPMQTTCPTDQFSFYIQSGGASVVPPKICIQNKLVLGSKLKNAGPGINIVIMNGTTGEVTKTGHFNMRIADPKLLIELLKEITTGSAVLITSFDDSSTKLNEEARELIAELGSSNVKSLGFRDSWGFVGVKGSKATNNFEKLIRNDKGTNKYINWPEVIDLEGCIPKFLE